jgi:hypothetical protein
LLQILKWFQKCETARGVPEHDPGQLAAQSTGLIGIEARMRLPRAMQNFYAEQRTISGRGVV